MEKLLEQLGLSSVSTVGISISAANIIEMICIDKSRRMITKYACKELKYNNAIREIISYDDFALALQELFKEIGVSTKNCNVVLNIPNVHFAFISLPLVLPDEQISGAISSEVEEMYLFKRHEPVISWNTVTVNKDTDKRYIVFGAVQENTIQNIKDIFDDLGCKLVAVETAHSSMIKGIVYSRVLEEEFENNDKTRIDCLTQTHAIEFDFADKWAESIGQALHYSFMTGKRAKIILILDNPKKQIYYFERIQNLSKIHNFDVEYVTPEILNIIDNKCRYKDCKCHKH